MATRQSICAPNSPVQDSVFKQLRLDGRTAIITGGAGGIGSEVAKGSKTADAIAAGIAENFHVGTGTYQVDVRSYQDVKAAVAKAIEDFGRLDVMIANAGVPSKAGSLDNKVEDWDRVRAIGFDSVYYCMRAAGRVFREQKSGVGIITASMSGHTANVPQEQSCYNACKAGCIHLAKSLAVEWAKWGGRINSVSPGCIDTVMSEKEWCEMLDVNFHGAFWTAQAAARVFERQLQTGSDGRGSIIFAASVSGILVNIPHEIPVCGMGRFCESELHFPGLHCYRQMEKEAVTMIPANRLCLAIAAGWLAALDAALFTNAVSALSLVAAWGGPVAVAFALIGIAIMIVFMCTHKPKNPIQDFIDNKIKPAGLYTDHLAIDYFDTVAATDKTAARVGVSIQGASTGDGDTASPEEQVYLLLQAIDAKTASIWYTKNLGFTTATVWSLWADGYGQSQLYTYKYFEVKDSDGSVSHRPSLWYLSVSDDVANVCVRNLPTLCDIFYKTSRGVPKRLMLQSDPLKKRPFKFALVSDPENNSTARYVSKWRVQSEPLGPQPFRYSRDPWNLLLTDTDSPNAPIFEDPLAVSSGYKWNITPTLPDFLELVTSPAVPADEGVIRIRDGKKGHNKIQYEMPTLGR
ncbi:hypothetical protein F5B21DRAFT_505187 [Xylaria acuta]|nr:hypothetical protein F5B21DRAFT_505187 [Xylaria acuta]